MSVMSPKLFEVTKDIRHLGYEVAALTRNACRVCDLARQNLSIHLSVRDGGMEGGRKGRTDRERAERNRGRARKRESERAIFLFRFVDDLQAIFVLSSK